MRAATAGIVPMYFMHIASCAIFEGRGMRVPLKAASG